VNLDKQDGFYQQIVGYRQRDGGWKPFGETSPTFGATSPNTSFQILKDKSGQYQIASVSSY
jgi:hypothetical protein